MASNSTDWAQIENRLVAVARGQDTDLAPDQISVLRLDYLDWCSQVILSPPPPNPTSNTPPTGAQFLGAHEDRAWDLVFSQAIDRILLQLHRANTKKKTPEVDVLRRSLMMAVTEASGFYHSILSVLQNDTVVDANTGLSLRFNRLDETRACRVITIAHCLCYLGRLENYAHFATNGSGRSFPCSACNLYISSLTLKPSGKCCSQMGAIYTAHNHPLLACYWYMNGLTNRDPSAQCATNMALLFKKLATYWNKNAVDDPEMAFVHHILSPAVVRGPLVDIKPAWFFNYYETESSFISSLAGRATEDNAILMVEMLLAALCKIMPKDSVDASRDLCGWHVARGLLIATVVSISTVHPAACMVLATWVLAKLGRSSVKDVLDTSAVMEVRSQLIHDWKVCLPEMISSLISILPDATKPPTQPVWISHLDTKLCQYSCLNDLYEKIQPSLISNNQTESPVSDPARLTPLKLILSPYRKI